MGKGKERQSLSLPMPPSWDGGFLHTVHSHTLLFKHTKTMYLPLFYEGGLMVTQTPQGDFLRVS